MEESRRSIEKCQKILGGEQNMTSVDRLSSLPDDVKCHILSFLSTKLSVATSVLGRRWRFLWAHVPCLNFSRNDFPDETEDSDISEDDFTGQTKYSDIIHRVILLHEAKRMDTFMLDFDFMDCNEYHLETWINFAIKRNVRNLYLDVHLHMGICPPRPLFTCQTIVDMRIYRCVEIRSSLYIHLPSLKKLYLYDADFENDEALPHLLSGCPLLEKLSMCVHLREKEKYLGCINVSSPTLKKLKIDLVHMFEDDIPDYRILINAKALRYLCMVNCHLGCVTNLANMTSLAEACIRVEGPFYLFVDIGSNSNVVKFLDSLCNVKCLRMTSYGAEEMAFDALERISLFERGSTACQLGFYSGIARVSVCRLQVSRFSLALFDFLAVNCENQMPFVRVSDREQKMASIDRLSSLPDEVICHILSFLPTKRSVSTSILGKRWRFLWAHVPCLHFSVFDFRKEGTQDSDDFSEEDSDDFSEEETQDSDEEVIQASDIIRRVILRHKAKRMDTLTLSLRPKAKRMDTLTLSYIKFNEYQLETSITTAIDRGIKNLYLDLDLDTFPRYIFKCKTIVDLKLHIYGASLSLSSVDNVTLPSLKKFHVSKVVYENDEALPHFLSSCPSLEDLNMVFTYVEEGPFDNDSVGCINISSPTIKKLKLDLDDLPSSSNFEYRMILNAPALTYLQVNGYELECITIPTTMISLVEADICLEHYNTTVVMFLHSLSFVKCLKISGWELIENFGEEQNMASMDKLSSLPDEAICHILSFLPTKLSMATSVLGKRWRFLWAHVLSLHFSEDDFREEGTQASDIIHRVILQHKAKRMDTLALCNFKCNEYQLETWIMTAIERGIQNLYLKLDSDIIPRSLFNCKTIVDLKLDNNRAPLSAMDNVSLPSLKKLYVYNVVCENDDALPRFLAGCPSLEELNMTFTFVDEHDYDYVGCINISSPTIKTLMLDIDRSSGFNIEYRIIINAPALRYLQVDNYALECITIPITMISLVEREIQLEDNSLLHLKTNYSTVVKFLHSLCYVKCLMISVWEFEEFMQRGVFGSNVKFDNLTKLKLQVHVKWSLLVKFLEVADNLEVLIGWRRWYLSKAGCVVKVGMLLIYENYQVEMQEILGDEMKKCGFQNEGEDEGVFYSFTSDEILLGEDEVFQFEDGDHVAIGVSKVSVLRLQVPFVKIWDTEQNMALIDRLSSLLDDVICHILSFLPTKLSVATSILGKRWRFLWAHVPCLDFSEDDFTEEGTQASDIIHRVILQHKAKIMDTLRLRSINYNEYELETLMTTVINRGIQNLYLQLDFIIFPRCIFNCKTIVDLHLDFYRAPLSAVDNVSLPSLKKFLVYHVVCENDESLPRFLSGCPSLEELDMEFTFLGEEPFDYGYVGCINISSPTIKTLKLDLYNLTCPSDDSNPKYRMIINAPALTYLQLYGYYLECITVPITMISLVEADIRLQRYNTTVVKFLQCYVKCLVMSGWELEEFVHRGVACSTGKFDNLTELELLWNIKWSLLVKFLQIADNLEVLIESQESPCLGFRCPLSEFGIESKTWPQSIGSAACLTKPYDILSFLPTKLSVATSVLGKRWRFLWAYVLSLHFSEDDFREEGTQASDIIHRVILQHKAKRMDTLTLSYVKCNEYQLETWIRTTMERGIRNLYLELDLGTFPRSLFNCKTIVHLKLDSFTSRVSLSAMDNVSLPSLKKFHVSNVVCENDEALPHFLSGCPSLEDLNMAIHFAYDYAGCINISSPTIKTLKLDIDRLSSRSNLEFRIIINAPALAYLKVDGYSLECLTIPITMISLVEADICFKSNLFLKHKTNYNSTLVKFLHSLCYVMCLKMSVWEFEQFMQRVVAGSSVKFDNLTKLELQVDVKWSLLVKFLEVADNLEVLILVPVKDGHWEVRIYGFVCRKHEFKLVRYLLGNSGVLTAVVIYFHHLRLSCKEKLDAVKRIMLFKRVSVECEFAFD
ncbi:F-box/RNI-like/FBD-like domains-containing protein [Striga asiatica]|uniref:F-box/RNI-like/FBD-like domains-containing protein n=1 Tax=Striga asiatica TaxID=4170 RepID=A0A5A7QCV6_STRAF|nr:F-box/RNI-like/FBD-like domains-containing protein [Striga asiatica]